MRFRRHFLSQSAVILFLAWLLPASAVAQASLRAAGRPVHSASASYAGRSDPAVAVSPGAWSQLGQLVPSVSNEFYAIAYSVAIDGDTIAVGSLPGFNQANAAAYIFTEPAGGWANQHSVAALIVPASAGWLNSIAMQGDTIVVGDSDQTYGPGTAYVFVKPAGGWTDMTPTATLTTSDGLADDYFGGSVAISGDTIVVGDSGVNSYTGAAYVYVKPAGGWTDMTETAKLTASDGRANDWLGQSVSIDGNTIIVGAPQNYMAKGKADVFVEPAAGWSDTTQTAELKASDGKAGDGLGESVSISGDTVVTTAAGIAYLFVRPATGWNNITQTAELRAADGPGVDFGCAVVRGKTAIAGASGRSRGPNFEEGGVYIFQEPAGGWKNMASSTVLTASDARHFSWLGDSLAMSGNTLVAGAPASGFIGDAFVFGLP